MLSRLTQTRSATRTVLLVANEHNCRAIGCKLLPETTICATREFRSGSLWTRYLQRETQTARITAEEDPAAPHPSDRALVPG